MQEEFFSLPPVQSEIEVIKLPSWKKKSDFVAEEVPVALVYNGLSHVVMMCSPQHLKEFAVGFSISEGIVPDYSHIFDIEIKPGCHNGLVVEMEISPRCFWNLKDQRRSMAGRTGCGICGTENLDKVYKEVSRLPNTYTFDLKHYHFGLQKIREAQQIGAATGSMHAVAALDSEGNFLGGIEDIGRHVALDKVLGLKAINNWKKEVLFLSSRASFEMVQKAAVSGIEIVFAISAPTNTAIELARKANITLAAFCRENSANVYTAPERLLGYF